MALKAGVERHLTLPHRFVCLTDMKVNCEIVPLKNDWPGWFSKIELFRPGLFDGPVFYADLDTIIVGSLDKIVLGHRFTMLENFWRPDRVGSGLMAWEADLSSIYERFARNARGFMSEYASPEKWGDQAFIKDHTPIPPDKWQHKHPGKVVSYKMHCRTGMNPKQSGAGVPVVPKAASVICYHGQPRPWETPLWRAA